MRSTAEPDDPAQLPTRIIIADDHPLFRSALSAIVDNYPNVVVVVEAADGLEALEHSRRVRPDLVLMDVSMPRMDGLEATRQIKRELPRTIVLVMSASEDPDHLAEAIKAGAAGYVLKSASPERITEAIRRALEGESPLDQGLAMELLVRLTMNEELHTAQEHSLLDVSQQSPPEGREEEHPLPSPLQSLSARELEVLRLLAQGRTNQQIAARLLVSVSTGKKHIRQIFSKLGVSDRTQAVVLALKLGLGSPGRNT